MSLFSLLSFISNHPLNQRQRARSIARFAEWQVRSRLAREPIVHRWVNGSKFFVRRGETGLTGNIYTGLHEFADMGYLLHVLRAEDLFVDVGANAGSYTLLACSAVGSQGIAVEPVPNTFRRLMANIELNGIEHKAKAFNVGLAAGDAVLRFTSGMDTVNHPLADGERCDSAIEVPCTSLDSLLAGTAPAMLKIDVEGFETCVLDGGKQTLENAALHSVIMELNGSGERYGFDEKRLLSRMLGLGFKTYSYDPLGRKLLNLNGKNHEQGNTLFIRNEALIRQRLATAPTVNVMSMSF